MAKGTTFIGWFAGGAGVVLLYSAYRNNSPIDLVRSTLIGTPVKPLTTRNVTGYENKYEFDNAAKTRAQRIASEQIQPTLVPIPSQPYLLLDAEAMTSFMAVQLSYGRPIILTGAYRTQAQQDEGYEKSPGTFSPGSGSLHLDGLAVDVNATLMDLEDPKLVAAFDKHGWFRRGKVLTNGKPEPWHWSYGVPG